MSPLLIHEDLLFRKGSYAHFFNRKRTFIENTVFLNIGHFCFSILGFYSVKTISRCLSNPFSTMTSK